MTVDDTTVEAGRLDRTMRSFGALLITVSCLSPSIGVFIVGSDLIRSAGTSVLLCFLAAALLGVAMAAVYAELGSAFPYAGGEYTMLGRILGGAFAGATLTNQIVGFTAAQSLSGQGVATYLSALVPGLPAGPLAAGVIASVTVIGVLNIRVNALVTGLFLAVELAALAAVAALGAAHPHRSLLEAARPLVLDGSGALVAPTLGILAAGAAGGVYAFNGYGSVVQLGEEIHGARRRMAGVVFAALGLAALTELAPVAGVLVGAPDLRQLLASKAPIADVARALGGPEAARAVSVGAMLAIYNAMIAVALMAGRQLYAAGRDRVFGPVVSPFLARVHPRFGSPWAATVVAGALAMACAFFPPRLLIIILGNGNLALYSALCVALIVGRRRGLTATGVWRSPLFPLAPVVVLVCLVGVAASALADPQGRIGVGVTVIVWLLGAALYRLVLHGRTGWSLSGADEAEAAQA